MKTIALLLTVLLLTGCTLLRPNVPLGREATYLENAHCDTTYGLLMEFGAPRACPTIVRALDRYSTTNEVDVGHRTAILNAPYHYQYNEGGDIHDYSTIVSRALSDPSPEIRSYFLHFVTRFPRDEALRILAPMLEDPDPNVGQQAGEAIDNVKQPKQNMPSSLPRVPLGD
jgi:hypothetical protein